MATSDTSLVNQALNALGQKQITDLSDDTREARAANQVYDHTVDKVLSMHPWNCAVTRTTVSSELADAPDWGFSKAFSLPSDFLRLDRTRFVNQRFRIEGGKILADEAVDLTYIRRIDNVQDMDPLLQNAIVAALEVALAKTLTGSSAEVERRERRFREVLGESRFLDSQQAPTESLESSLWLDARSGGKESDREFDPLLRDTI